MAELLLFFPKCEFINLAAKEDMDFTIRECHIILQGELPDRHVT